MRVPVKQRVSRSSPASAATSRTKNKRRVSSDGAPPAKTKKRKLPPPPPSVDALPEASASAPVAGVVVVPPKRKPIKKPTSAAKKGVGEGAAPKIAAKKPKVVKGVDAKLTATVKGKVVAKKVPAVVEKKIVGVKTAKKLQSRKLSTASLDGVGDVARDVAVLEKGVAELASVVPKKASKKAVKVVAGDGKAKALRVKVKDDAVAATPLAAGATPPAWKAAKKKAVKSEKKAGVEKVGDSKRAKATPDGKKTRRKSASDGVGADEAASEPTASMFANSQFDVIDDVARNLTKGAVAAASVVAAAAGTPKKTKENDEKESSSAIKNKIVGGKNKKQLTKKTPKSVDEVAGKKGDGVANEISDVVVEAPATINDAGEKLEINLPDKDLLDKEIKSKIVIKKSLKEKKPQVNTIKKKVMFKKTSTKVGVAVKPAKVTFKVKESEQQSSKKRPPKKGKKSSDGQQVADGGSSFQDDYNSSTSDDCTLDLLLRRQKQIKQEELNATTATPSPTSKACGGGGDVKPVVATSVKAETTPSHSAAKSKTASKIAPKSVDAAKKLVKKPFAAKCKTQPLAAKKAPSTLSKLKLAAARKKAIVSKVKRMRSNEVSKLGSGSESEQRARRMKLFGFWSGPKRHRVASLNALAKVHCLYENESRGALMSVCAKPASPEDSSAGEEKPDVKTETVNTRTLRSGPGRCGIGQHWDQQTTSSSSSSEDNGHHSDCSTTPAAALNLQPSYKQKQLKAKAAKPIKKASKPRRHEAVMDLKDMVVRKRMASLNASAILSASYSPIEKLQKKQRSVKDDDSPQPVENDDDDSHVRKKKCKKKIHLSKKLIEGEESDEEGRNIIELATSNNKKVATVIVNQDTDVTITGVYVNSTTHRSSTTHEGYCSIAGMQYLISSTSHTKTEARAVATETLLHAPAELVPPVPTLHPPEPPLQPPMKSYTPLGALSIMQPPGGPMSPLARRHGCASAFSAPPLVPPVPPTVAPPPPPPHHHHHHAPPAQEPPPPAPPYLHGKPHWPTLVVFWGAFFCVYVLYAFVARLALELRLCFFG